MKRVLSIRTRTALVALMPVLGIAVVAFATRRQPTAGPARDAHQHVQPVGNDLPQPVTLTADAGRRIGITYAVVAEERIERDVRVVGQVAADETRIRTIALKVDGWVERLYADAPGQRIAADEPIMAVYSPMLSTAQEELLVAKRLIADVGGGDSASRANAESLLAAARGRLAAWGVSSSDIARIEASDHAERTITLRSPASGYVIEKNVFAGQRVMAGDALYRIVDLSQVWLEGEAYEQDLAALRVGQRVTAEIPALPGVTLGGRIAWIAPTLNLETRTAQIRVEVPNPGLRLKPGMVATLHLTAGPAKPMLTVPRAAVLSTGERSIVFVKRPDGMLEPRVVRLGPATEDRVAILGGVARGDSVVASATFLVDAESSLGTAFGGMGDMPGMDITTPKKRD